jgi:hypothetical protein
MKRLCAWCGQELAATSGRNSQEVTHGICVDCRCQHLATARREGGETNRSPERGAGFQVLPAQTDEVAMPGKDNGGKNSGRPTNRG